MKKIILIIMGIALMLALCACVGNQSVWDGLTDDSNTFHYILTCEGGEYHLHELARWIDSSSDAVGAVTKCCNNRIWTSYNNAILYKELPEYLPEGVHICGK